MRNLKRFLALATCLSLFSFPVHAQEVLKDDTTYRIVDVNQNGDVSLIKQYDNFNTAYDTYQQLLNQYDNLCSAQGLDYIEAEVALVSFQRSEGCDINVEYIDTHGKDGYTNGCYAGDGAYLSSDDTTVTFQLSGVQASASIEQVDIIPFHPNKVSYYLVKDQRFYHYIKTNVEASGHGNVLSLGIAPKGLQADLPYYSYDGHYFYSDYASMIDDYRKQQHTQAINAKEPYYNYYQYVSHRSSSNYTYEEVQSQFGDVFGIQKAMTSFIHDGNYNHMILSDSVLLQGLPAFFQYQNQFGANAMMMMSLAMNESNYGRSPLAFSRNNLFGHAAYDEAVDANASGYHKVADSIYYHANHYISLSYLNPESFTYHGAHFGNKAGGMNVSYASDPYWGEKAAQFYLSIDEGFGSKDYESYRIGVSYQKSVAVKKVASSTSQTIYNVPAYQETAFLILAEETNGSDVWYQIALDVPILDGKDGRNYDFSQAIGYVKATDLDYVSQNEAAPKEYVNIHFDAGDGYYYPNEQMITLSIPKGQIPTVTAPELPQYHFIGYQEELVAATSETTYHAKYLKIDNVEIVGDIQSEYAVGEYLNISNVTLKVTCGDEVFELPLTTDYVSNFTSRTIGTYNMYINYGGYQIKVPYEIKDASQTTTGQLQQKAAAIIASCANEGSVSNDNITKVNELMEALKPTTNHPLEIDSIRYLDRILEAYNVPRLSVVIKDDQYDLQASGLAFQEIPSSFLTKYVPVTVQIHLDSIKHPKQETIQNILTSNYYQLEDIFKISLKADFTNIKAVNDMVYSLQKPENSENKLYRVFELKDDGTIIQVPSEQSENRITFQSEGETFALVSVSQSGIVDTFDFTEVYHQGRSMRNYITLIQTAGIGGGVLILAGIAGIIFFMMKRKKK